MSKDTEILGFGPGFCFGTILMRSSHEGFYYNSIKEILKKRRFYLVTVGDEEDEEIFFIKGRELFTLYFVPQGYQILRGSDLERVIQEQMDEDDSSNFHHVFGCSIFYSTHFRDLTIGVPYRYINEIPNTFTSLQECVESIKPLGKDIRIYCLHTSNKPYSLEEIIHYGYTSTNNREE